LMIYTIKQVLNWKRKNKKIKNNLTSKLPQRS